MSVILDILGSMAIRGTMVVVILNVNLSLHSLLYKKTSQAVVKENMAYTSDDLNADLKNIGLNATSGPFLIALPGRVKFLGDVDGNGSADTIYYYVGPKSELSGTENPNDMKLYRVFGNQAPFDFASGITKLNFQYYDDNGVPTTNLNDIKSISVELQVEHSYAFDNVYPSSYWETHIFPENL